MACINKALIVGGGPGGLTTATALGRKGVLCDLVEITETGQPVGAAITLMGRALEALDEIGVLEQVDAIKGEAEALGGGQFDMAGRPLEFQSADAAGGGARPPRAVAGMYRPLLSQILTQAALDAGVQIRLGTSVVSLEETDAGVLATLSDGSTGLYDLVVGADGIRSKVRAMVFGDAVQPQYAGQCCMRWMAKGPPVTSGPSSFYHTEFGKFLGYPLPKQNLTYVAVVCDGAPGQHVTPAEARDLLRAELDKFTAPYFVEMRERLGPDEEVLWRPFEWLLMDGPWHKGRVLLIGDAAHATTAHMSSGGAMAIEDAVVLAQVIDKEPSLEAAFDAFMRRRLERVRTVVETSLALCRLEEQGASPYEVSARGTPAFMKLMEAY